MSRLNACEANHDCCWLCDPGGVAHAFGEGEAARLVVDFHGEKRPPQAPFDGVNETGVPTAGSPLAGGFE